jgi:hypothetical protein
LIPCERPQRYKAKAADKKVVLTEVWKMSGICTLLYHSVKASGERLSEVILDLTKRRPGTPIV